jgi:hypothetical protein
MSGNSDIYYLMMMMIIIMKKAGWLSARLHPSPGAVSLIRPPRSPQEQVLYAPGEP